MEGPGPHGHSLRRGVHKIRVVVFVTNSYLMRLDTPYPNPGTGGPKGGPVGFWGLSSAFWAKTC